MPRAAALPATWVVLLMVFGTVAEATRISGAPPDSEVTAALFSSSPTTGPPATTPVTAIELCEPGQSGPNCLACSKDKQSCQDKCQASISCSSHGRCRGRNGPPIIVYAPIEQMKTSSSSQAPTTYQGDDCSAPIAPAACDGEFAGPECMAYSFWVPEGQTELPGQVGYPASGYPKDKQSCQDKDKQSCQDKCQASITCSSHGRCRGRNGPPIIVYAPIEQMKTSSSSQAPTTSSTALTTSTTCSNQHGRCRGWTGECECFEGCQGDDCSEPSAPPVLKITISLALSMDGFTPSVQLSVLGATSAAAGVDPTKAPTTQRAALTVALRRNACQQPMPATRLDLAARRGERRRGGRTRGGAGCVCGAHAAAGGVPPVPPVLLLLLVVAVVLVAAGGPAVAALARGGGSRQGREAHLRRLCLVCAASLLVASAGAATVVGYKGYEYRVLDGTAPTVTSWGCQDDYLALPAGGWALAPDNADAVAVTAAYRWGTGCLVFANGDAWQKTWDGSPDSCGSNWLRQSGNTYKPSATSASSCYLRILLRRPCAAGGYFGATMTTYAEAPTATCTLCGAGRYSSATGASSSATCASCTAGTYSSAGAGERDCVFVCVFLCVCVCVCVCAFVCVCV